MNQQKHNMIFNALVATCTLLVPASFASAADFYWNNGEGFGGVFADGYYWDDPDDPYFPGEEDTAIFDVAGVFGVSFGAEHDIDRLVIRHGRVSFFCGQDEHCTAHNTNPDMPGVVIGLENGDVACLRLANGMNLESPSFSLGRSPDSLGMLRLTEDYAKIDFEDSFRIGDAGVGFMYVGDADIFMHTNAYSSEFDIGSQPGSFGRLVVTGPDVYWRPTGASSTTSIGRAGAGELLIADGARFRCADGRIGNEKGSIGTVTVDAAEFSSSYYRLDVGSLGVGSLDIINGGIAEAGLTTIGTYRVEPPDYVYGEGGVGRITATGEGSTFVADDLYIGYESVGTLRVAEHATAEMTGNVTIAYLSAGYSWDSKGTLSCSEGGTFSTEGDLIHGMGDAHIVIELSSSDDYLDPAINVIGSADSFETEVVLLDDFIPQVGDVFHIVHADGGLNDYLDFMLPDLPYPLEWDVIHDDDNAMLAVVENPAPESPASTDPFVSAGQSDGPPQGYRFGNDFFWNNARDHGEFHDPFFWNDGEDGVPGEEDIAYFDAGGVFEVEFPEQAVTDRLIVRKGAVTFNLSPEAGYEAVNNLAITPGITIGDGDGAAGSLSADGGALTAVFTDIGFQADSVGYLAVNGPDASLVNGDHLHIGFGGAGIFQANGGVEVSNTDGIVGAAGGSYGRAAYSGPDTRWDCSRSLTIGRGGFGELTISDGAEVTCLDAIIAHYMGSMGSVTVSGPGSSWTIDGTLDVGMTGFGSLSIEDGASVWNHTFAVIGTYPGQDWILPGEGGDGEVTVTGDGSIWTIDGDLYIGLMAWWADLTIADGGEIEVGGNVYNGGDTYATLAILGSGNLHVGGDFVTGDSGDVRVELAEGSFISPAIYVNGSMNETFATVVLAEDFTPQWDDVFHIVHADGGVDDVGFMLPDAPPNLEWEVFNDGYDVKLLLVSTLYGDINGDAVVDINDVFAVLGHWGECDGCPEDLNQDGFVDINDLFLVLDAWT